jgi:hypothetical protein
MDNGYEIFHDEDGDSQFFINYIGDENLLTFNITDTDNNSHNIHFLNCEKVKILIRELQRWIELQ